MTDEISTPMTDGEVHEALRDAILRLDPRFPAAYQTEVYFKQSLDMFLLMIPAMVDGLWQASEDNSKRMATMMAAIKGSQATDLAVLMAEVTQRNQRIADGEHPDLDSETTYVPSTVDPDGPPVFNKNTGTWVGGRQRR